MTIAIALDLFVAVLLVATITYAFILNRKLSRLRADRQVFETLLKDFTVATQRAEGGVALLQKTAAASAAELDSRRDSAKSLREDLEFLVARAGEQADRLDSLITQGREKEMPRARAENIFDRIRSSERMETVAEYEEEEIVPANDPEQDAGGMNTRPTPGWLQSARQVAGAERALR